MRILVTGGAGFIGSHLVDYLKHWGEVPQVIDIKCGEDCRRLTPNSYGWITKHTPQFIYHLASTVGVTKVLEDPKECIENIIDSTRAVLSLGIPGIYISTSEVYGKDDVNCIWREDDVLILGSKMRWTYAAAKLIGEYLARLAGWKIVRLFNVVGPRQNSHYGAVLPRFVQQALAGDPITVYGTGTQVRTFLDVRDCVQILDTLRDKEFDICNVGGPSSLSIQSLAHLVIDTLGSKSRIVYVPYEKAYPGGEFEECPSRIPDLTKMHSLIGKFTFRELKDSILEIAKEKQCQAAMV